MSPFERQFSAAVSAIDPARLKRDLQALRDALVRMTRDWHLVEAMATQMKLEGSVRKGDQDLLLTVLRHAVDENRHGLKVARRFVREHARGGGVLELTLANAMAVAPRLSLHALPAYDVAELRVAGLTDPEILEMLRQGIRSFRESVVSGAAVGVAPRWFASADSKLKRLGSWGIGDWRVDIVDGDSGWEVFWDGVKIVGGAVIVAADLAGAVETLGATIVSVASGAGLIADGARDLDKDTDEAMGIPGRP